MYLAASRIKDVNEFASCSEDSMCLAWVVPSIVLDGKGTLRTNSDGSIDVAGIFDNGKGLSLATGGTVIEQSNISPW